MRDSNTCNRSRSRSPSCPALSRALRECQLAHHQAVVRWRGRCAETRGPERLGAECCVAVPGL
jgi:hypothetical protein